jgi:glycine/D-amino acid oxidase-like deaminating enzyme
MIDALVIGGGFYGVSIAAYLVLQRGLRTVRLVEREPLLLSRASYNNQARIHNGYHYPRSYVTAYRSRINLPRFVADFPFAVNRNFAKLYAVARRNSKVNARQFQRFCKEIGARLEPAAPEYTEMFDRRLVEAVFLVEEFAFDAAQLQAWAEEKLAACDVEVNLNHRVELCRADGGGCAVDIVPEDADGGVETVNARYVFNCTYSGLNHLGGTFRPVAASLKHEVTELGLIEMPPAMRGLGITVMDGPFFSAMPFPARNLHSISHVRYTPHLYWYDEVGKDPYKRLDRYAKDSRVDRMIRDAKRYMPGLGDAVLKDSLFEVKTVLAKNEGNDGRPILFEKSQTLPGFFSVLGGKIDNIYDIISHLDKETLERGEE